MGIESFFKDEASSLHEEKLLRSVFSHIQINIEAPPGSPMVNISIYKIDKNRARRAFVYDEDIILINERLKAYFSFLQSCEIGNHSYSLDLESLQVIIESLYKFVTFTIQYSFGEEIELKYSRENSLQVLQEGNIYSLSIIDEKSEEIRSLLIENKLIFPHSLLIRNVFYFLESKHIELIRVFNDNGNKVKILEEERDSFLARIHFLFPNAQFEGEQEIKTNYKLEIPQPILYIKDKDDFYEFEFKFSYKNDTVECSHQYESVFVSKRSIRNLKVESHCIDLLIRLGFYYNRSERLNLNPKDFSNSLAKLLDRGWRVIINDLTLENNISLDIEVNENEDDLDNYEVIMPEGFALKEEKNDLFFFDEVSKKLHMLTNDQKDFIKFLESFSQGKEDNKKINKKVYDLATQAYSYNNDKFISLRENIKKKLEKKLELIESVEGLNCDLRAYQQSGLAWLYNNRELGLGSCLADDMGLGKTVQVIALLTFNKFFAKEKTDLPNLIVVPRSLIFNWVQEFNKFSPRIKVLDYSSYNRRVDRESFAEYDVILTTYQIVVMDLEFIRGYSFDSVVLDEAHLIKNDKTQRYQAFLAINAKNRIALTGTPLENNLKELFNIVNFLNPQLFLESNLKAKIDSFTFNVKNVANIKSMLSPFILRRTKGEVGKELPELSEEIIYCDMSDEQKKLYEDVKESYSYLIKDSSNNRNILNAINTMRQLCCHPKAIGKDVESTKFSVLLPYLRDIVNKGQKLIVFSNFTKILMLLKEDLKKEGIDFLYLDGKVKERGALVERFQNDPKQQVFLISIKTGGLGLNLTKADYIFILDPWWNKSVENQAISRSHRLGRTEKTFCYKLICRDSLEEKILKMQEYKEKLSQAILDGQSVVEEKMSYLQLLFSGDEK